MRLFLALELPESVRNLLGGFTHQWLEEGRSFGRASWVRRENLHATLKFLGEVSDQQLPLLCESLKSVPFEHLLRLWPDRIECLPPNGPVRVIGVGLMGELDRLAGIHRAIEDVCEPLGFARERRKYRPHVTLARMREFLPSHTRASLARAGAKHLPGPEFEVSEFVLMQSELHPQGSRYTPLARFAVRRADAEQAC